MAEYVDKYKAYLLLKDLEAAYIYPPVKEAYGTAARRIDQIKPADVQPVKHGRWKDHHCTHIEQLDANLIQAKCACCGRYSDKIDSFCRYLDLEYCSHCGARMDLKDGDTE